MYYTVIITYMTSQHRLLIELRGNVLKPALDFHNDPQLLLFFLGFDFFGKVIVFFDTFSYLDEGGNEIFIGNLLLV